ncbi:MAG: hypothetical protein JSS55_04440 [Proteobacteria bacterium]|nr:hypothetical protein [Pseudomonadota bacterium]
MTDANQTNAGDAQGNAAASEKPAEKFKNQIATLKSQAGDKARDYAGKGLGHASDALDEAARFLTDTAKTVDEKLGPQYGRYGLSAAESVSGLADQLRNKDVNELLDDARELVRKSPGIAIGAAVGLGFVLARLAKAGVGFDDGDKDTKPKAPKPDTPSDAA